jgi:hypothetical protein
MNFGSFVNNDCTIFPNLYVSFSGLIKAYLKANDKNKFIEKLDYSIFYLSTSKRYIFEYRIEEIAKDLKVSSDDTLQVAYFITVLRKKLIFAENTNRLIFRNTKVNIFTTDLNKLFENNNLPKVNITSEKYSYEGVQSLYQGKTIFSNN